MMTSFQSGLLQLVVGVDGEAFRGAVDAALRAVDRGDHDQGADVFELQALRDEFCGIDLDAHRGLLLAADRDLRDAGDLADLLRELGIDVVATVVSGSVSDVADSSRIGESAGLTLR